MDRAQRVQAHLCAEVGIERERIPRRYLRAADQQDVDAVEHRAFVHIEGNFPGGVADLTYRFTIDGDSISALTIGG
jgi:hypothetical protein